MRSRLLLLCSRLDRRAGMRRRQRCRMHLKLLIYQRGEERDDLGQNAYPNKNCSSILAPFFFGSMGGGKARFMKRAQKAVESANDVVAASAKAALLGIWAVGSS